VRGNVQRITDTLRGAALEKQIPYPAALATSCEDGTADIPKQFGPIQQSLFRTLALPANKQAQSCGAAKPYSSRAHVIYLSETNSDEAPHTSKCCNLRQNASFGSLLSTAIVAAIANGGSGFVGDVTSPFGSVSCLDSTPVG
jgi:hypothetical protein